MFDLYCYAEASGHALERMAGSALECAELRVKEIRGSGLGSGSGLEAKLGQVEAEVEAAMREDMSRLGLEPDEAGLCKLHAADP
jgi:hypothetical protein